MWLLSPLPKEANIFKTSENIINLNILKMCLSLQIQVMETNKTDWDKLFELYPFFESYKNYLQIDICAANGDDLRNWKGWVESRLRQLTLKVIPIF